MLKKSSKVIDEVEKVAENLKAQKDKRNCSRIKINKRFMITINKYRGYLYVDVRKYGGTNFNSPSSSNGISFATNDFKKITAVLKKITQ